MIKECLNKKENEENCSCLEKDCERYGICCECIKYHQTRREKPACLM